MPRTFLLDSDLSEVFGRKLYMPAFPVILFSIILSGIILFGTLGEGYLTALLFLGVIPVLFLMVKYPKIWIYVIALTNIYFFYGRGEEVTTVEIILGVQYLGSLGIWFFWQFIVKREKLILNIADLAVIVFFIIMFTNILIAYLNDAVILSWGREAANFLLLSIYFPVRKYFTEKKDIIILLVIYSIVVTVTALLHVYTYQKALDADLVYAYQLARGIRVNQTLFTSAVLFGFIYALYNKIGIKSIIMIAFTCIAIVGLVTTFSRTFWVILIAQLFVIIFYLSGKQRIKLITYALVTSFILLSSALFLFPDRAKVALALVENRLASTAKGTKDVSVQSRLKEYDAVWNRILDYPLGGNGMGKKISFWSFLEGRTAHMDFTHNGYLHVMFRVGIPATIICFFPYLFYLFKGESLSRRLADDFYKMLCLGSFMSIALMLISNITSAQTAGREGTFVSALSFAFVGIVLEKVRNGSLKLKGGG